MIVYSLYVLLNILVLYIVVYLLYVLLGILHILGIFALFTVRCIHGGSHWQECIAKHAIDKCGAGAVESE